MKVRCAGIALARLTAVTVLLVTATLLVRIFLTVSRPTFTVAQAATAPIVGVKKCANCHEQEVGAWAGTHHRRSYEALKNGAGIAAKLGVEGEYRKSGFCLGCHATVQDGQVISGVSCESCHGPAAGWVDVHSNLGEQYDAGGDEVAEHRKQRLALSDQAGMIRKDRVHLIARNCYGCHTVPREDLVNVGGHKAGSDFELVAWSQGEVRHSYLAGEGNKPPTVEHLRLLYVVGAATDLEMSLRAGARITQDGAYKSAVEARIQRASARLGAVLERVAIPELMSILAGRKEVSGYRFDAGDYRGLPDTLATRIDAFAARSTGAELAAVDALLPSPSQYHGAATP